MYTQILANFFQKIRVPFNFAPEFSNKWVHISEIQQFRNFLSTLEGNSCTRHTSYQIILWKQSCHLQAVFNACSVWYSEWIDQIKQV